MPELGTTNALRETLVPIFQRIIDLGSSLLRWRKIWTLDFDGSGTVTVPTPTNATDAATKAYVDGLLVTALTIREVDLAPSVAASTILEFDQADGFVVTNPAGTQVRVDLAAIPSSVISSLVVTKVTGSFTDLGSTLTGSLLPVDGGTGIDTSASTGVAIVDAGTWSVDAALDVAKGGTNLASGTSGGILAYTGTTTLASSSLLTNRAIIVGGGAGVVPRTIAAMTNGQLPIGSTGADPVPAALTAGNAIAVTNAAGAITLTGIPRSYLAGLTLSTAGASATMTTAVGQAVDSTNADMLTLLASTGKTTGAWTVGSGNGGIDTGAIANSTWYKFYLIKRVDTGVVDVIFTTAALGTGPALPASYTLFRYIGSGKTDGAAQWTAFTQAGNYFQWNATVLDVDITNPGISAVTRTLTVPTGVNVYAHMNVKQDIGVSAAALYLSDLAVSDEAPSITVAPLGTLGQNMVASSGYMTQVTTRTNTSAQIRSRINVAEAGTALKIVTLGWTDVRGRDA